MTSSEYENLLAQEIGTLLREHQSTTGMQVASGVTCKCGYWTGIERPGVTRPPGYSGLQWHQAEVIALSIAALRTENTELRVENDLTNAFHEASKASARDYWQRAQDAEQKLAAAERVIIEALEVLNREPSYNTEQNVEAASAILSSYPLGEGQ